jgi:hypothetical protein
VELGWRLGWCGIRGASRFASLISNLGLVLHQN